jgi:dTDP-glucose 4,6-dehydratase
MRVLVTGGAGFIGSTACRRLISDGISVVNADKMTYAANPKSLAAIAHTQLSARTSAIALQ